MLDTARIIMRLKMTQKIIQVIFLLCIVLTISTSAYAEIKVSQSISESKIAFEDSVQFQILIEWEGSQTAYLFHKPLSPYIDRMKIREFSSSVSSHTVDGVEITRKKYDYTLIPTSAGLGLIDSISIAYMKRNDSVPGVVVTEPMEVLIANPIAKVKDEGGFNYWLLYLLLFVIIVGVLSYLKLRKNKKSIKKGISPKEQFLAELTTLKNESVSDMKKFQTQLYSALSKYLVTEYKVDVSKMNADAIIGELSNAGMSIKKAEQIRNWIQQAEIDKYAPITQSPGAVVRLESEIRTFFEKI